MSEKPNEKRLTWQEQEAIKDEYVKRLLPGGFRAYLLSLGWLAPCEGRIEWWEDIALLPARIMIELMERKGRVHCIIDSLPKGATPDA